MKLVINGAGALDGEYPCDISSLKNRELERVKIVSGGIRAGELIDALDANDVAAFVGLAVVVLAQHEKHVDPEELWDAPVGSLRLDLETKAPVPLATGGTAADTSENTPSSSNSSESDGES